MKNTLIVTSSNRPWDNVTRVSIENCLRYGARWCQQTGSSDVVFARNHALTMALNIARDVLKDPKSAPINTLLMVDDDMEFGVGAAQQVIDESRKRDRACSGLYVGLDGVPAASRWVDSEGQNGADWLVGLGFMAIPMRLILEHEAHCQKYEYASHLSGEWKTEMITEFTWSGVRNGHWFSEDYYLSEKLGGVVLLPIPIGHRKVMSLGPSKAMIESLKP